ncbi:hypothetical protein SAMN04488057_117107 [Cyclobacterium lianum]|uniref:Uncharacterized protein n=1 Tax=Cyclobacterium lianum TaxID=388280 RepID=A0A1M7QG91_9BACT|nr:hypothetical protein SAMN04488057_117107 [Cyclobacterium lianum]
MRLLILLNFLCIIIAVFFATGLALKICLVGLSGVIFMILTYEIGQLIQRTKTTDTLLDKMIDKFKKKDE